MKLVLILIQRKIMSNYKDTLPIHSICVYVLFIFFQSIFCLFIVMHEAIPFSGLEEQIAEPEF